VILVVAEVVCNSHGSSRSLHGITLQEPRFLNNDWLLCIGKHLFINSYVTSRGVTRGAQFPGRRITVRGAEWLRGTEKSRQYHKQFLQYSTSASERPQVYTWGRQTCFLPRAPSNLVTPLVAGVVITAAKAVIQASQFAGVVAVDMTLNELLEESTFFRPSEFSYSFVVDEQGKVLHSFGKNYLSAFCNKLQQHIAMSRFTQYHFRLI